MVGLLIGSFIGGLPADLFGRKPILFFFIFVGGFGNLIGGLVSTYPLYVFFRLLAGIGEQGLTQVSCTMTIEMVGAKYQAVVGNINQVFFALGTGVVRTYTKFQ
jgi:SP family xylose:H+ symportor-like MFS transporter